MHVVFFWKAFAIPNSVYDRHSGLFYEAEITMNEVVFIHE